MPVRSPNLVISVHTIQSFSPNCRERNSTLDSGDGIENTIINTWRGGDARGAVWGRAGAAGWITMKAEYAWASHALATSPEMKSVLKV
jgi:hypothetical protein